MSQDQTPVPEPSGAERQNKVPKVWPWHRAWWTRDHLTGVVWAAAVFIVVTVVGMLVQNAAQATGFFGQSVEALIAKQQENFDAMSSKIDQLSRTGDPVEQEKLLKEIQALAASQESLNARLQTELREARVEIARLREDAIESRGTTGAVQFWIAQNESAVVGTKDDPHVVGVTSIDGANRYIYVNYNNKSSRLSPGQSIDIETAKGVGKVTFRQSKEGRAGFDWAPPRG